MPVYFDKKDFDRKMERLVARTIPQELEKGMAKAGMQLLNDCTMQAPTTPLDEGTLRGSGSVFVENQLVGRSPKTRGRGTPSLEHREKLKKDQTVVVVGFNTPYAGRVHEGVGIKNWSEPSSGPKFLEAKLANNRDEYMKITAEHLREAEG